MPKDACAVVLLYEGPDPQHLRLIGSSIQPAVIATMRKALREAAIATTHPPKGTHIRAVSRSRPARQNVRIAT